MNGEQTTIAVYWDFENIHASILEQEQGVGAYKASRFSPQEKLAAKGGQARIILR